MFVRLKPPGSRRRLVVATATAIAFGLSGAAHAQDMKPDLSGILESDVLNPAIPPEEAIAWAKVMGKALFWDQQIGSDGMACASCHYAAGADIRTRNVLNPGFEAKIGPNQDADLTFGAFPAGIGDVAAGLGLNDIIGNDEATPGPDFPAGSLPDGRIAGPNYEVQPSDFPFQSHVNPLDRNGPLAFFFDDVVSSPGSFDSEQVRTRVSYAKVKEKCDVSVATFHMDAFGKTVPVRAVEPRNTPTTINAAFNFLNFWDGRASNLFNGFDPFGASTTNHDPAARPLVGEGWDVDFAEEPLLIGNASLASQAVGPPLSNLEMSCDGRMWPFIGAKMLSPFLKPLAGQTVSMDDSVLGPYSDSGRRRAKRKTTGLSSKYSYRTLMAKAFNPKYWAGKGFYKIREGRDGEPKLVRTSRSRGYSQAEMNFSLFFGVAVMLYETELVSDTNRFDEAEELLGCVNGAVPDAFPSPFPGAPGVVAKDAWGCVEDGVLTEAEADGAFLFYSGQLAGPLPSAGWYDPDSWGGETDSRLLTTSFAEQALPTDPGETGVGGRCFGCHVGDLLTTPATVDADNPTIFGASTNILGFGTPTGLGFHNIGSRPVNRDVGAGGVNPHGDPHSHLLWAKRWLMDEASKPPFYNLGDTIEDNMSLICQHFAAFDGCPPPLFPPNAPAGSTPAAELAVTDVIGAMKTPSLNNVALTPPYFSYGGYSNLTLALGFYARGGNRRDLDASTCVDADGVPLPIRVDSSGTGLTGDAFPVDLASDCAGSNVIDAVTGLNLALVDLCPRLDPDDPDSGPDRENCSFAQSVDIPNPFGPGTFTLPEKDGLYGLFAIGEYLKTLTDERVRCDAAPFDHPELFIGHGHDERGKDIVARLPEVGSLGYDLEGMPQFCLPNEGDLFAEGMQNRVDPAVAR